jgi:hypothetical protein
MSGSTHLSTWIDLDARQRFAAIANHEGMSESALLRRMILLMLQSTKPQSELATGLADRSMREARITLRLRSDDRQLLKERASARGMPAATYVSVLLRSHLRCLPPLPKEELLTLRRTVSELGRIGRNLNQIARAANQSQKVAGPQQEDLRAIFRLCQGLRDHVKELLKSNVVSWEIGYAEEDR